VKVVHLSKLEGHPVGKGGLIWKPLRHTLGIEAFGTNAYTAKEAGDEVVEHHDETRLGHQELYVVVSGHATFHVNDEEVDAPAGTCVFLDDPRERRGAVAKEPGTIVLAVGGKPGEAYRVSPWEYSFRAIAALRAGRKDEARAIAAEVRGLYPDNPGVLYNTACLEALEGEHEAALADLARAVELDGAFAEYAVDDEDFASVRNDPRFLAITGQPEPAGSGT
jgi:tetratricopeptide (TPR) repeat protein